MKEEPTDDIEKQQQDDFEREIEAESEMQVNDVPTGMAQSPELTKWQLDPSDLLSQFAHELKGEVWDETQGKWVAISKPVMNDKGIQAVLMLMRQYMSKSFYMTNLDRQEVYDFTLNFSNMLAQTLYNNGEEYLLDFNTSSQNAIIDLASDLVFSSLARGLNEGERRFLGSVTKVLHRIDETPQRESEKKKFGLF